MNEDGWRNEVASVSSPILRTDGSPLGAVTISIPFSRFDADRQLDFGALVVAASWGLAAAVPADLGAAAD